MESQDSRRLALQVPENRGLDAAEKMAEDREEADRRWHKAPTTDATMTSLENTEVADTEIRANHEKMILTHTTCLPIQ